MYSWCPGGDTCEAGVVVTANLTIKMTDSWGDGWNDNTIGIRDSAQNIIAQFGSAFTQGKEQIQTVVLNMDKSYDVVPVEVGPWREEIGLILTNQEGVVLFSRQPGTSYPANVILGSFCFYCATPTQLDRLNLIRDAYGLSGDRNGDSKARLRSDTDTEERETTPEDKESMESSPENEDASGFLASVIIVVAVMAAVELTIILGLVFFVFKWRREELGERLPTEESAKDVRKEMSEEEHSNKDQRARYQTRGNSSLSQIAPDTPGMGPMII